MIKGMLSLTVGVIAAASLVAPASGQEMEQGKMGGMMEQHHTAMMQMHQQMETAWKKEDAELDKLLTQMNSTTGDQKIQAMAAVINKLVELRKKNHDEMSAMHNDMSNSMQKRMRGMSGASPSPTAQSKNP
jgi:gas vesicle protein